MRGGLLLSPLRGEMSRRDRGGELARRSQSHLGKSMFISNYAALPFAVHPLLTSPLKGEGLKIGLLP